MEYPFTGYLMANNTDIQLVANLNDTVQQSDIVPIRGPCEQRRHPVGDLLCHPLRTHTVVLQKQLDAGHKPGMKTQEASVENTSKPVEFYYACISLTAHC